jgi:hypothetical protein
MGDPSRLSRSEGHRRISRTIVEFMTVDETACKERLAELGLNPFRA